MGVLSLKRKSYVKCKPNPDRSGVQCIAYRPDKNGTKHIIATAEFNTTNEGDISTVAHDGDPDEIENLTKHALKYSKVGKSPAGEF